jgi:acyl-CoA thioesterase-2
MHAYFLRPGDPNVPILYEVDRIRDGRSFTTRRVVAVQHGKAIFNLSASFHTDDHGLEHQMAMPDVPEPSTLPPLQQLFGWTDRPEAQWHHPFDVRHIEPGPRQLRRDRTGLKPIQRVWFRTDGHLPDDFLVHACVVAYASDLWLLDTAALPHPVNFDDPTFMAASLDHAMWFHRPFRADEWLLYDQESPIAHGGRALVSGRIFTEDGRLVVSVVQEGLTRLLTAPRGNQARAAQAATT